MSTFLNRNPYRRGRRESFISGFDEKETVVLDVPAQEEPPPERRDPAAVLTALMGPSPMPVDALIRLSGLSPATVNATLVDLDLAGRIERHGSGLVSLR